MIFLALPRWYSAHEKTKTLTSADRFMFDADTFPISRDVNNGQGSE